MEDAPSADKVLVEDVLSKDEDHNGLVLDLRPQTDDEDDYEVVENCPVAGGKRSFDGGGSPHLAGRASPRRASSPRERS